MLMLSCVDSRLFQDERAPARRVELGFGGYVVDDVVPRHSFRQRRPRVEPVPPKRILIALQRNCRLGQGAAPQKQGQHKSRGRRVKQCGLQSEDLHLPLPLMKARVAKKFHYLIV